MANVFIEARPKGHAHNPIKGYVIEDQADHVLHSTETLAEAIAWAHTQGYSPLIVRFRDLNDKKKRNHWRTALS